MDAHKICKECGETKPISEFPKGLFTCKACKRLYHAAWTTRNIERVRQKAKDGARHRRKDNNYRLKGNAVRRKYYARNRKEEIRRALARNKVRSHEIKEYNKHYRFIRHGTTLKACEEMLKAQNFLCAACKEPLENLSEARIDHDHKCCPGVFSCGKCIRGLLHSQCNTALGLLSEDPEKIRQVADYIEHTLHKIAPASEVA